MRYRIALAWFLTSVILQIHAVHGFSTAKEFESLELIDLAKLKELKKEPRDKDYSIYKRVRDVGAINHHFGIFRFVLSFVFVIIAILALALPKPIRANQTSERHECNLRIVEHKYEQSYAPESRVGRFSNGASLAATAVMRSVRPKCCE